MKQLLQEYVAYNLWANQLIGVKVAELDPALWTRELPGSFPSLHKTLMHMCDAESAWLQRLQGVPSVVVPSRGFEGNTLDLVRLLGQVDEQWMQFITGSEENSFVQKIAYTNMKGQPFEQPLYQLLLHVFNHSTYHRGQLVNFLRALEVDTIPQTDFVAWARGR